MSYTEETPTNKASFEAIVDGNIRGHTLRRLLFRQQQFSTLNNNLCCIDVINVALWLRVPRFYYFVKRRVMSVDKFLLGFYPNNNRAPDSTYWISDLLCPRLG
ncbi:hypothetical protein RRG08_014520 [Elysia crispata]|uniref:Uncharacterized protein n=1 Tax=Elysia crispata TaxID=231223 RepID=A0AAE1AVW1_9GAST|nr:hypothetical protein RRG08_014520 [Elysia crispata]